MCAEPFHVSVPSGAGSGYIDCVSMSREFFLSLTKTQYTVKEREMRNRDKGYFLLNNVRV